MGAPRANLVLTMPNAWTFHHFISAALKRRVFTNPTHTFWPDKQTLHTLLHQHRFRVQKFKYIPPQPRRKLTTMGVFLVGGLMWLLGLKEIAGEDIFVVCTIDQDSRCE